MGEYCVLLPFLQSQERGAHPGRGSHVVAKKARKTGLAARFEHETQW